jgi:hypothetical protein
LPPATPSKAQVKTSRAWEMRVSEAGEAGEEIGEEAGEID